MSIVSQKRGARAGPHYTPLDCCPAATHLALLADLEADAPTDPDIAALLPRARYLLTGRVGGKRGGPWWIR